MTGSLLLAAVAAVWAGTAWAQAQPDLPALTGQVVDVADLLPPAAEAKLTDRLAAHDAAATDQVVVVTAPTLEGEAIERFANRLANAWGIGQADRDNGVVLVVAPNERLVRIEVGLGVDEALTDAVASGILKRDVLPRFREGDIAGGIVAGVNAILGALAGPGALAD